MEGHGARVGAGTTARCWAVSVISTVSFTSGFHFPSILRVIKAVMFVGSGRGLVEFMNTVAAKSVFLSLDSSVGMSHKRHVTGVRPLASASGGHWGNLGSFRKISLESWRFWCSYFGQTVKTLFPCFSGSGATPGVF